MAKESGHKFKLFATQTELSRIVWSVESHHSAWNFLFPVLPEGLQNA